MILAYEDEENGPDDIKKAEKRKTFQKNLEEQGLELELEPSNVSIQVYRIQGDNFKIAGLQLEEILLEQTFQTKACLSYASFKHTLF